MRFVIQFYMVHCSHNFVNKRDSSLTLQILLACTEDKEPPKTVKS